MGGDENENIFLSNLVFRDENEKLKMNSQGQAKKIKLLLTEISGNENFRQSLQLGGVCMGQEGAGEKRTSQSFALPWLEQPHWYTSSTSLVH